MATIFNSPTVILLIKLANSLYGKSIVNILPTNAVTHLASVTVLDEAQIKPPKCINWQSFLSEQDSASQRTPDTNCSNFRSRFYSGGSHQKAFQSQSLFVDHSNSQHFGKQSSIISSFALYTDGSLPDNEIIIATDLEKW